MRATLITFLCLFAALRALANPVLDWNALMIDAIRLDNSGPTLSSRNLAILHTAIYDSVNSITRTHQQYRFKVDAPAEASVEAAVTGTGYGVLSALYPGLSARADELLDRLTRTAQLDSAFTNGFVLGTTVARMHLAAREADGANTEVPYIPSELPGEWRRTPPFFRPPVAPHWRYVDLFGLPDVERFLPPSPPTLESAEYAESLNQVKALGGKTNTIRTAEQSQIAVFWSDFSYTSMPPGHWHLITADIARDRNLTLPETARLFAQLSIAQADSGIVCWEAKYRWNLWRPVTAIQRANEDSNPLTERDASWDHFLASPPFPSYPSGHSTFSKASAQVLTHFFGTDAVSFRATSDSLANVFRTFNSLSACADEIGMSRIYGGIHFSFDNIRGKESGKSIGDFVATNWLLPNQQLPSVRLGRSEESLRLRVHAIVGTTFTVQSSADLRDWQTLSQGVAQPGGVELEIDDAAAVRHQFYRIVQ